MENDGWTYEEKEDGLALGRQPLVPVEGIVRTNLGREQLGRTKAGKQREKKIAQEREQLKKEFDEREAAKKIKVPRTKCRPCKNRSRQCDSERPHCGTCIRLNIAQRCIYDPPPDTTAANLDSERPFPPDVQSREVLVSTPTAFTNAPNPSHTPGLRPNAITKRIQGEPEGFAGASQPRAQNPNLGKKRKRFPHFEEQEGEEEEEAEGKIMSRRCKRSKREAAKGNH